MTIINGISGAVYTRGFPLKDKLQLYGTAAVFLVLLYNSPAGLVLYWTSNNVYNLVKNILQKTQKTKYSRRIIFGVVCTAAVIMVIFVLFFHQGTLIKRIAITGIVAIGMVIPFAKKTFVIKMPDNPPDMSKQFFLSAAALLLLAGLVIPGRLVASSVAEFSNSGNYISPLLFIGTTFLQAAGTGLWLVCIYLFLSKKARAVTAFLLTAVLAVCLLNTFIFSGNYGFMLPELDLSDFSTSSAKEQLFNLVSILFVCAVTLGLYVSKNRKILLTLQNIIVIALFCFGVTSLIKIGGYHYDEKDMVIGKKIYTFSKTGKNLLVIDLDRAISGYVPYIFEEKPELSASFNGFVYYPNTASFGPYTIYGTPPVFGGYYYTPLEIQKRTDELWYKKYYESMQILPRIMAENGFKVTVNDQPWMDNSLYNHADHIHAQNVIGNFTGYLRGIRYRDYDKIYYQNLIRFSLFKMSPLGLRTLVYDHGDYLSLFGDNESEVPSSGYSHQTIDNYASLYVLPDITDITDKNESYAVMFVNTLTHDPAFFEPPDYTPSKSITNKGDGPFAGEDHYHANMAAFLLLAKWFNFLKENGVYDNTRIIIVSDHGRDLRSPFPGNITLPNGHGLEFYAALLMVKDFDAEFEMKTDKTFMTNADVPHIAAEGIVHPLINPFTGKELVIEKSEGVTITTAGLWDPDKQGKYRFTIKRDEWLHVRDNIFDIDNWHQALPPDNQR